MRSDRDRSVRGAHLAFPFKAAVDDCAIRCIELCLLQRAGCQRETDAVVGAHFLGTGGWESRTDDRGSADDFAGDLDLGGAALGLGRITAATANACCTRELPVRHVRRLDAYRTVATSNLECLHFIGDNLNLTLRDLDLPAGLLRDWTRSALLPLARGRATLPGLLLD